MDNELKIINDVIKLTDNKKQITKKDLKLLVNFFKIIQKLGG